MIQGVARIKTIFYLRSIKLNYMKTRKFTTNALLENQFLKIEYVGIVECHCIGYTNGKRDKSLDGYYLNVELKKL